MNPLWQSWFDTVNGLMGVAAPGTAPGAAEPARADERGAAGKSATDPFALWGVTLEQYERVTRPWAELTQHFFGFPTNLPGGGADPLADVFERSFGLLVNFPGIEQELPTLMREAAVNWAALAKALTAYNAVMMPAWLRTGQEVMREVQRRATAGEPVDSSSSFLAVATSVSDRVLVETFRSDAYVKAHRALSDAIAKQRIAQNKVVDLFARDGHFATRRDLDEALREIVNLRRELRTLARGVRRNARTRKKKSGPATAGAAAQGDEQ